MSEYFDAISRFYCIALYYVVASKVIWIYIFGWLPEQYIGIEQVRCKIHLSRLHTCLVFRSVYV